MEQPGDPDEEAPKVMRRDQPVPPPWVARGDAPETNWVGRPVPHRPMSSWRRLVVSALVFFLLVQIAGTIVAYTKASSGALPWLLPGAVFTLLLEIVGWWVVYRLVSRR